jgi:hypothetical protein
MLHIIPIFGKTLYGLGIEFSNFNNKFELLNDLKIFFLCHEKYLIVHAIKGENKI